MKWLRIIPSMNPKMGGPSQGIRNSIPELEKMGIQNEVVSFDDKNAPYVKNADFPIHAIGPSKGPWAYCPAFHSWLAANMGNYDVVIVHGLWLYHSYEALRVLRQYRKRKTASIPSFYVMPHGMLDPYFQKAKGRKLKAIRNWLYWKWTEGQLIHDADGVLFTTEEELLLAKTTFKPYKPQRELNVSYGVNRPPAYTNAMTEAFLAANGRAGLPSYLLFLSRIHPKKGVDLLIKAYLQLKNEGLSVPPLVIAGPGIETSYGQEMKLLAGEADIIFPGMLTGDAKWGAFYGAQAFILPSHQENFGIAIAEALACSVPVLISDKINIWREIKEFDAGIVADDSLEGTIDLLRRWFESADPRRKQMSDNAKLAFDKSFSIEDSAKKMAEVIRSIQNLKNQF